MISRTSLLWRATGTCRKDKIGAENPSEFFACVCGGGGGWGVPRQELTSSPEDLSPAEASGWDRINGHSE